MFTAVGGIALWKCVKGFSGINMQL